LKVTGLMVPKLDLMQVNKKIKEIGKMKFSKVYPHLKAIADEHGLRLNVYKDFKIARLLLVTRYGAGTK